MSPDLINACNIQVCIAYCVRRGLSFYRQPNALWNVAVQSKRLYCKRLWRTVAIAVNWIPIHVHRYMYTTLHCNGYTATNHGSVAYRVECHFLPLVESMESKLFDSVRYNTNHVLHQLLPPVKDTHYNLRQRSHSLTLPAEDNNLIRKNFLHRMLFRDIY